MNLACLACSVIRQNPCAMACAKVSMDPEPRRYSRDDRLLHALEQRSRAESATAAHRDDRSLTVRPLELVKCLGDEPAAGRAERMAKRNRAAVRIHTSHVGLKRARPAKDHGGERLIDLEQVDVADSKTVFLEELTSRRHRPLEHEHRVAANQAGISHTSTRPDTELSRLRL